MRIEISAFTGKKPKVSGILLKENQAQAAMNVRCDRGEVYSWPEVNAVQTIAAGNYKSLFQYYDGSNTHWVVSTNDLDFVLSPIANDTYKRLFFTGEAEPRAFANDIISTPWDASTDFYKIGHAPPAAAITTAASYTPGSAYRAWYYTYVNRYGEESGPSPVKSITDYGSGSVVLTAYSAPGAGFGIKEANVGGRYGKIRLYRSMSSVSGAEFQFVKDTNVDNTTNFTTLAITDDVADADLGAVCPTELYDIGIPSGIAGLVGLPSGMVAGFVGNTVYFSELLLPGSWSSSFKKSFPYKIVGLAPYGAMLFVLTEGLIYIITGVDPTNLSQDKFNGFFPCVSKRGIAVTTYGVIFPTYEGLILVSDSGPKNITFDFLTDQDWNSYYPAYMHGEFYSGKYFGFYYKDASTYGAVIFDVQNGILTDLQYYYLASYVAVGEGKFYVINGIQISEWAADPYNHMYYTWKSKDFVLPNNANLTCAKIISDPSFYNDLIKTIEQLEYFESLNETIFLSGDVADQFNGDNTAETSIEFNEHTFNGSNLYDITGLEMSPAVVFKLYADGELRMTKTVVGDRMFRLPSGFRCRHIEIEIQAFIPIQKVILADTPKELN